MPITFKDTQFTQNFTYFTFAYFSFLMRLVLLHNF